MDMSCPNKRVILAAAGCLVGLLAANAWAQPASAPVAGLQPDRRPEGAPVLQGTPASPELKAQRLRGIGKPWPGNVERIAEQQGGWYSPMFTPGMNPPYDLRNLHAGRP